MRSISFYLICAVSGLVAFLTAYWLGTTGNPWVLLVPILVSPVCMFVVRRTMEHGSPSGLFSPKTQSWAFLFGDTIALPFAFAMLALGWRTLQADRWYSSNLWYGLAVLAGLAIAYCWHNLLDAPGYISSGHAELLGSPSKIWHDFAVYGSLSAALVYLGIPVLAHDFIGYGGLALLGLILWGAFGAADNTFHKLDPADLHPPQSETTLA